MTDAPTIQFPMQATPLSGTKLEFSTPPQTIIFHIDNKPVLWIGKNGIRADPDVSVDDAAKAIFVALEPYLRSTYEVPTSKPTCASCVQEVEPTWTYCPSCGSQDRNSATGERLVRVRTQR
jgi:hypothetical protein